MPVPLAFAAPAAVACLAYLNARTQLSYDYRLVGTHLKSQFKINRRLGRDEINPFYFLEEHAKGSLAEKTLLIFDGRSWSYRAVYETVLKYGTWLKTKYDIKPKEIVAMDFMNSDKFIFIWFGLWAIGAKPAFINYNLTDKAFIHCINVSASRLVLIDPQVQHRITQEIRDQLPNVLCEVFSPEFEAEVMSTVGVREHNSTRSEDKVSNLGMIVFTSGTTGLPKGAVVSWNKIVLGSMIVHGWSGFGQDDTFYTCMPLYHSSASCLGFSMALIRGATICIGKSFSTKTFWKDCRSSNATVIQYVGETCRYLLSAPPELDPDTGANLDKKHQVRMAFGNGLRPDIWNRFKERFGIQEIAEFYSATEGTAGSWNFSRNDFGKGAIGRIGSLGTLLGKSVAAIVEIDWETEQPWRDPITKLCKKAELGQPGELIYAIDPNDIEAKFQGYFNNKASTEGKILRNVLQMGDAWFRTGDVIIWDAEGRSFFSDRIGDTFRWKAENVSTSEVSEVLGHHGSVSEANVYGVQLPHHDGRAGCVALVLTEEPSERVLGDIARHAQEKLPRFAVPIFLRLIKEMQITGTNKQQKHVVRTQGVDPDKVDNDVLYWLKDGTYVKFNQGDWKELNAGRIKL